MTAALATQTDAPATGDVGAPGTPRPRLRVVVRSAPRREPPFDDELDGSQATGTWDQWLPFTPANRVPVRTLPVPRPSGLIDPTTWGRRLLIGLIESADGRRPLQQLSSLLSLSVSRGLYLDFERAAAERSTHWLRRGVVRTVRACEPAEGVAEVCATVDTGRRVRAVALRLETRRGRWCCTRLQLG